MSVITLQEVNHMVDEEVVSIKIPSHDLVLIIKAGYDRANIELAFEDYLISYLSIFITDVIGDDLLEADHVEEPYILLHNLISSLFGVTIDMRDFMVAYDYIDTTIRFIASDIGNDLKIGLASRGFAIKKLTGCYIEKLIFNELLKHNSILTIKCVFKI